MGGKRGRGEGRGGRGRVVAWGYVGGWGSIVVMSEFG